MRVLHLIKATQIGGAERHLLILLTGLRRNNIDARLLVLIEPDNPMADLLAEATVRDIPVDTITIHSDADPSAVDQIRRYLQDFQPAILHTHLVHADTYGVLATRFLPAIKVISSRHNDDPFRSHLAIRAASYLLWRSIQGGIAISDHMRRFVIEVEGAPEEMIRTVRYGIEPQIPTATETEAARATLRAELGLEADATLIGMACRLTEQKGITYALQAFAQIKEETRNTFLVIAGNGPLRDELEEQARRYGLIKRVIFLGWRDDVPQLLRGLDLFLMPSLWEGFGLVLLEAMQARLPVIASAVSAIPEVVVDGETGLLIPPRDVDALLAALRQLLADEPLRAHMGTRAVERVQTAFAAERMTEETLVVYRQHVPRLPATGKRKVTIN